MDSKGAKQNPGLSNRRLSEYRAINIKQAIKDILGKALGIPYNNIIANGFGCDAAAKAWEKDFRNLNRRKAIFIYLNCYLLLTVY